MHFFDTFALLKSICNQGGIRVVTKTVEEVDRAESDQKNQTKEASRRP